MGPLRITTQEARTLTVILIILLAGLAGMVIWGDNPSANAGPIELQSSD
ncbi:MAG: hypothetical protein AAFX93_12635 [Verrucomicrobiota bacterium]